MNELYQQDVLSERKSLHFQEIVDLFSSFFGGISADPIRGMKNLHQLFPVLQQEMIREAVSGRQAYNIYLGKHNVGKIVKMSDSAIPLPNRNPVNHFGLSNPTWYTKASGPLVFSGVFVNFVEIALEMFQRLSKMVVRSEHALVVYGTIVVDQKALSPGACLYHQNLFGISPSISVADASSKGWIQNHA